MPPTRRCRSCLEPWQASGTQCPPRLPATRCDTPSLCPVTPQYSVGPYARAADRPGPGGGLIRENHMFRFGFRALIAILAVASTLVVLAAPADARIGGGLSAGSRGNRSFSAPPPTSTAPSASPFQRTTAQPSTAQPSTRPAL